jgi:DNA-binding protein H-NS
MTKSYAQIKAEIAKLEKEAAVLLATETTKVVAQMRGSIAKFGLTVEQLFGQGAEVLRAAAGKVVGDSGKALRKGAGIAKYRDSKTGKTWTGFGKAPGWIAKARSRDRFLIDQSGVLAVRPAQEAAAPEVKKAALKARAVAAPAKKANGTKKAARAELTSAQATAKKPVAKKAAAKTSTTSRKAVAATKASPAPKGAKVSNGVATAKKVATKAVKSQPSGKSNSRMKKVATQPVVPSASPGSAETAASLN